MEFRKLASIVLPVYKQADHIGDVVKEYEATLSDIFHETILVVNGDGDESLDVCRALEVQYETVRGNLLRTEGVGTRRKIGAESGKRGFAVLYQCGTDSAFRPKKLHSRRSR